MALPHFIEVDPTVMGYVLLIIEHLDMKVEMLRQTLSSRCVFAHRPADFLVDANTARSRRLFY